MVWQGKTFTVLAAPGIFYPAQGGEGHPVLLSNPSPWSLTAGATKQCDKRREHFALCVHKSE